MKKLSIILVLIAVFCLISCSKELSRGKAEKILSKGDYGSVNGEIPSKLCQSFHMGHDGNLQVYAQKAEEESQAWLNDKEQYLDKLKSNGFITYEVWKGQQGVRPDNCGGRSIVDHQYRWIKIDVAPTDKLKPYIVDTRDRGFGYNAVIVVKLKILEFDKITGIVKRSENESSVDFTLQAKATPLNDIVGDKNNSNNNINLNKSALFIKYDDGWRLAE